MTAPSSLTRNSDAPASASAKEEELSASVQKAVARVFEQIKIVAASDTEHVNGGTYYILWR